MKIHFVIDPKTGAVMAIQDIARREAKGWKGTFKQFGKEWAQTGKEFAKEMSGFVEGEFTGANRSQARKR